MTEEARRVIQRAYKFEIAPTTIQKLILNSIFECERTISNWIIEQIHFYYEAHLSKNINGLTKLYELRDLRITETNAKIDNINSRGESKRKKKEKKEFPSSEEIQKIYNKPFPKIPTAEEFSWYWNNIVSNEKRYEWMQHSFIQKNSKLGKIKHYPPSSTTFTIDDVISSFKKFNELSGGIFKKILEKTPITYSVKEYEKLSRKYKILLSEKNNSPSYIECRRFLKGCPIWKKYDSKQSFSYQIIAKNEIIQGNKSYIKIKCIRDIINYIYETPIESLPKQYSKIKPFITEQIYKSNNIELIRLKENVNKIQETAKINSVTIVRRSCADRRSPSKLDGGWHVSLQTDNIFPDPYIFPEKNEIIGIDLGSYKPIVTSNDEVDNGPPKTTNKIFKKKKREQRALQRKRDFAINAEKYKIINLISKSELDKEIKKNFIKEIDKLETGKSISKNLKEKIEESLKNEDIELKINRTSYSNNYEKNRIDIAKLEEKLSNIRNDHHAKYVNKMLLKYEGIKAEDLNIKGISAHGGARKKGFNKKWLSLAHGDLLRRFEYKAKWMGRKFYKVDPKNTSKTCSNCKEINDSMKKGFDGLSERIFKCEKCGFEICRDLNAAINMSRTQPLE